MQGFQVRVVRQNLGLLAVFQRYSLDHLGHNLCKNLLQIQVLETYFRSTRSISLGAREGPRNLDVNNLLLAFMICGLW